MGTNRHDRHLNVGLHKISNHIGVNLALVILLLLCVNIATVYEKSHTIPFNKCVVESLLSVHW